MSQDAIAVVGEPTVTVRRPAWVPDPRVVVLMVASGILEYFDTIHSPRPFRLPYPLPLQMALDRLTLFSWHTGAAPPIGVVELLGWATIPFGDWPVDLEDADVDLDESLVRYGRPTATCEELGTLRGDIEGEVRENSLIRAVMDKARAAASPEAYVAFRRLLIERPAITALELDHALTRPELAVLAEELRRSYVGVPPEAEAEGVVRTCAGCHGLCLPVDGRTWMCADPSCPAPAASGPCYPAAEGIYWLRRELRTFIVAPGRAELRIAEAIENRGVAVRLWPDYDACDLSVFDDSRPWVADVKAWRNPVRLAHRLRDRPFEPPNNAERAYIVVAGEQLKGQPDYLARLHRACPQVGPGQRVEAVTEPEFIKLVSLRGRSRA